MDPDVPKPELDPAPLGARLHDAKLLVEHLSYRAPAVSSGDRSVWLWRRQHGRPRRVEDEARGGVAAPRLILDDVSFAMSPGRVFTVLGPSGSGKTTLLRALDRLVEPTAGRVLLDGTPMTDLPVQELRRRVGMVFQTPALFDGTVADNVLYGLRLAAQSGPQRGASGRPAVTQEVEARAVAGSLLRRVGLPDSFCEKPADELSGGEAQRVALARALANDPEVLLLDEPTAALDPSSSQIVEDLLRRLAGATDLTFVFVTHDLAQARRIGDHGLLLADGRVVDAGPLPEFLDHPSNDVVRRFVRGTSHGGAS